MSVEALWTVEFGVPGWVNGGIAVLETGRIFGGDSQYYYLGAYQLNGDRVTARARITHYSGPPFTAFGDGASDFEVELSANRNGDQILGELARVDRPDLPALRIRMHRRAPLP